MKIILNKLKNETIIANIAESSFIQESISPLNITLTSNNPGQNGGLSYLKNNTNDLNIKFIHDYYKNTFNINLPKDTKIIFGAGTTMMIQSLYYALQKKLKKSITITTNNKIYFILHERLVELYKNMEWYNDSENNNDLVVIVSPSNPLGIITDLKEIKNKYILCDLIYDNPIFTGKFESVNLNLYKEFKINKNIFITSSFSKLGIPGVRCGFLITRDNEIANYCNEFVNLTSVRYPTANITIGRIVFYKYYINKLWHIKNYNILQNRINEFINVSKKHGIKILNETFMVPFIYTNKSVNWWMKKFNVETRKGSDFNDTDKNSRFNLMIKEDYWIEFMRRFIK